jgi:hypothetical protein
MTDAKTLLLDLLAVIPDGGKSADLFAQDGVLELPFLHGVGIPTRHEGRTAIKDFYNFVGGKLYPDFGFKPEDIKVLIETPNQIFAEYTGRLIHHLFAGRLVAEQGKIRLLRESLNTLAAAQALNPHGAADVPPPGGEIFSVPPGYVS